MSGVSLTSSTAPSTNEKHTAHTHTHTDAWISKVQSSLRKEVHAMWRMIQIQIQIQMIGLGLATRAVDSLPALYCLYYYYLTRRPSRRYVLIRSKGFELHAAEHLLASLAALHEDIHAAQGKLFKRRQDRCKAKATLRKQRSQRFGSSKSRSGTNGWNLFRQEAHKQQTAAGISNFFCSRAFVTATKEWGS